MVEDDDGGRTSVDVRNSLGEFEAGEGRTLGLKVEESSVGC